VNAKRARSSSGRVWAVVGGLILLLLIFSSTLVRFYTDYLWFQSVGYTPVFTTRVVASLGVTLAAILVAAGFLTLNWSLLPRWLTSTPPAGGGQGQGVSPRRMRLGSLSFTLPEAQDIGISSRRFQAFFTVGAVVIGVIFGLFMSGKWSSYLLAREGEPFGVTEPIFNLDVGFYVFQLPWYETLLEWGRSLVAVAFVGILVRYGLLKQTQSRGAVAHLSLLGALWLGLLGVGRLLDRYTLLQSEAGVVLGAGYTDIHARLPLYVIEMVIFFVAAALLFVNAFVRDRKLLLGAGLAWLVISVLGPIYPALVQRFTVEPNEFVVEKPYIEHNIAFTRAAYGLDKIQEQAYPGAGTLSSADLAANADIIQNIRLWDYRPLQRTYAQLQEIRLYYSFNDVDVDRYVLNGQLQSVMLAVRELDSEQLAEQAQTWVNRHLIFTHGYGLALSPVNVVSQEGLPQLYVRDLPPTSTLPELTITRPEIYFGELTWDYILVNGTEDEFDYPRGDANAYTRYTGPDGVAMDGLFRRALLALRFNSVQLLLSPALTADSRVLFYRTLTERSQTIAPFLWYDSDPYPVIADGRIIWILDAYTWTDRYPYSEKQNGLNYLRNSVKVTLDAYTGEINYYLVDPTDPIAAAYARIFPTLFHPVDQMPQVLRDHWRYPETLYLYQSVQYSTYHMRDPQVFYNREDLWAIPSELVETGEQEMEPYYVVMRLPGQERLEFMMIRPYVPKEKQNMVAWLYADSDGADYGQLGVFNLSKDRLIYGPLQVEGRVNQDPTISQQLTLWDQRGSRVLRGNLMVVPLKDTFLYVEPLYLESESGQLPELKRVIVTYNDHVAMAPTLAEALLQVLAGGGAVGEPETPGAGATPTGDLESLAQQAWEHYQAGQACLEQNDWECYGRAQAQLEAVLKAMVGEP